MDAGHRSNTAYSRDNYSQPVVWPGIQDVDWTHNIRGHPCYDPQKARALPRSPHAQCCALAKLLLLLLLLLSSCSAVAVLAQCCGCILAALLAVFLQYCCCPVVVPL